MVAGGLMRVDEGGAVRVRAEEDGEDPLHATKVVQFGKVRSTTIMQAGTQNMWLCESSLVTKALDACDPYFD